MSEMVPLYVAVSNAFPMHRAYFRATSIRGAVASFHSSGIPRSFETHSNYREFRSSFRESASDLEIIHSRWQSAYAEVDRWCTAGACRACRESRCTMANVSPPLRPTFPRSFPFTPRTAIAAPSYRPAWPTFALHQSPVNLGLAAVGSRG